MARAAAPVGTSRSSGFRTRVSSCGPATASAIMRVERPSRLKSQFVAYLAIGGLVEDAGARQVDHVQRQTCQLRPSAAARRRSRMARSSPRLKASPAALSLIERQQDAFDHVAGFGDVHPEGAPLLVARQHQRLAAIVEPLQQSATAAAFPKASCCRIFGCRKKRGPEKKLCGIQKLGRVLGVREAEDDGLETSGPPEEPHQLLAQELREAIGRPRLQGVGLVDGEVVGHVLGVDLAGTGEDEATRRRRGPPPRGRPACPRHWRDGACRCQPEART